MVVDLITPIKSYHSQENLNLVEPLEDADDKVVDIPDEKPAKIQKIQSNGSRKSSHGRSFNKSRTSLGSSGSQSDLLRKNVLLKQTEISLSTSFNQDKSKNVANNDSAEELLMEDEDKKLELNLKENNILEKIVKRSKRKNRVYIFVDDAHEENERVEKTVIKSQKVEKVPKDINGRKPFWLVRGIQYDLGEGVGVDLEEDEEVVKKYRNEKYDMDSFCMEAGYLSEDEMFETPKNDKIISKMRTKRRAQSAKSTLRFGKIGEPEVMGCFWWGGKSTKEDEETKKKKKELKKWTAFTTITCQGPIPTNFSSPIPPSPKAVLSHLSQKLPVKSATPLKSHQPVEEDYATKYAVKYYIKRRMEEVLRKPSGSLATSTPRIGTAKPGNVPTPKQFIKTILEEDTGIVGVSAGLVDKYVYKYYFKFKNTDCF